MLAMLRESREDALRERRDLFMLAALAYTWTHLEAQPKPGHDITAILAWNVEDLENTPDFIIDRNRNFLQQGELYHAEANVLRLAYRRLRRLVGPAREGWADTGRFAPGMARATVFTSLEPCPMCHASIHMAGVPRGYFCLEDPWLRDPQSHELRVKLPQEYYGKHLELIESRLPACLEARKLIWTLVDSGQTRLTKILADRGEELFKPAYERLTEAPVRVENAMLRAQLLLAVGKPWQALSRRQDERLVDMATALTR